MNGPGSSKEENSKKQHEFSWADKYQPKALKDFICHREIAQNVAAGDDNHFIIEGLPGIGKRTMALALLTKKFGLDILETREEVLALDLECVLEKGVTMIIEVRVQVSAKHIEVNLCESDMKGYATDVALLLIMEIHKALKMQLSLQNNHVYAKAIVFHQAEKISKNAQPQIQSLLETSGQLNVIFCCSEVGKLQVLKPICRAIHLPPPPNREIVGVLNFIAKQEGIELPQALSKTMAENSTHCLRQAIRSFEATWLTGYPFEEGQSIMSGWEDEISTMAKSIIEEQSPNVLFLVRKKIITLMEHHICRDFILSNLVSELIKHVPQSKIQLDIENLCHGYARVNFHHCHYLSYCKTHILSPTPWFAYYIQSKSDEDLPGESQLSYKVELFACGMTNCQILVVLL
ncbi:EMBRYO DEFECTIVE 251, EMBRYO DEFECTIVE 2775, replication factor C 5, replication factor C 3 [Hibiscus trionum]|uniref:EMBRYO DEFECTIVE 251, EMBRYO DEFECTIVE 2775, replication factor C 5, replication factor C 3 n=1 Tax=Hibiscus trionum TaxID=183268 RepID=A0A9W7GQJ8_HIBTR|nr:EMBRYO DEFECTIVE 251, EMBRYO DEFECTIVE 2775, replication factor C 5, replication factor C 3 [Hibiscus trionum]